VQGECAKGQELEQDPETKAAAETVWLSLSYAGEDVIGRSVKGVLRPRLQLVNSAVHRLRTDAEDIWGSHSRQLITFDSAQQQVIGGTNLWKDALDQVLEAVKSWSPAHDCDGATTHLQTANTILLTGHKRIATGIARLKSLS
jgi:hypothetical protein